MGSYTDDINDEDQYEVQEILARRVRGGRVQYQIKWQGWDNPQDLTWQPIQHLQNVMNLVQRFETHQKERKDKKTKLIQKDKNIKKKKQRKQRKQKSQNSGKIIQSQISEISISDSQKQQHNNSNKDRVIRQKKSIQINIKSKKSVLPEKINFLENKKNSQTDSQQTNKLSSIMRHYILPNMENSQRKQIPQNYTISHINNFYVDENNKIYYDVDIASKQNNVCVGVMKFTSKQLIQKYEMQDKLAVFLEDNLIEYERIQEQIIQNPYRNH